jgi:predicted nucleic acid-binding protein
MILVDTGPLVAIVDPNDDAHDRSVAAMDALPLEGLATTWACFTESIYLLGTAGSFALQADLWRLWRQGYIDLIQVSDDEAELAALLMEQYQDHPMDLADATLVAVADVRGWRKVFTLDTHFFSFRLRDGSVLDIILPTSEQ